ncbi:TIGR02466 family protein [Brevundimonas sp. 2R-24]|uniref:TIGR02466 family protein n=1 Tax=Peiella sedimenti TaxID=3061083 RepID=A0ABT8SII5_9CAUL|nr:TIGR02466 family protein [Caulobacteraceae bacterium XZ-24]
MTLRALFATQVYHVSLSGKDGFTARNGAFAAWDDLKRACLSLADEDRAGIRWCRENAYPGYTSYASLDDLPLRDPVFAELKRALDRHAALAAQAMHLDLGRKPRLDSLWVNVLKPGGGHSGHIHPHSILSGTVYVALPDGASPLKLEDPRLPMMMARPTLSDEAPEEARPFVYLRPQPGDLVLWESWLRHEVPPNRARSVRISVSFNYA